ncbi:MAG: bifunctional precorrin-2 dehydrogenase/sirohydrochlorin ferrochelatase, partial [Candidatus Nitrosopolaris sp.]
DQNCKITVLCSRLNRYLSHLREQGRIELVKTKIKDASVLDNYNNLFLVLAATNDRVLNRMLVEKARSMGLFVYAVDDPAISDFSYASIINIEGVMQVAISTSGKSPIMSRRVRIKAERMLRRVIKKTDIENTKLQEFARAAAKSTFKTVEQRKKFLYSLIENSRIQNLIKEDKTEEAKSTTLELLREWERKNNR